MMKTEFKLSNIKDSKVWMVLERFSCIMPCHMWEYWNSDEQLLTQHALKHTQLMQTPKYPDKKIKNFYKRITHLLTIHFFFYLKRGLHAHIQIKMDTEKT